MKNWYIIHLKKIRVMVFTFVTALAKWFACKVSCRGEINTKFNFGGAYVEKD